MCAEPAPNSTPLDSSTAMPSATPLPHPNPAAAPAETPRATTIGRWLYTSHLAATWSIAISNNLLGLTLLWSLWKVRRPWWSWPRAAALVFPLGLYVTFLLVSVLMSVEPAVSFSALGELFSLTTLPLGILWLGGGARIRRLFDLLILVTTALALHGIWQYHYTDYGDLYHRIPGLFSHYLTYSGILMIGDLLLVARMLSGGAWRRPWAWAALAVINYTLLLTLSRSAWVALVVTMALYGIVRGRRYLLAYGVGLLLLVFFAPDSWSERMRSIYDLQDASNYDRLCMIDAGLEMIAERPLFGLGPDMVERLYPIYRQPSAPRFSVPHLHNSFLQLAAERGLASLAAYLWMTIAAFLLALRGYRREGGSEGPRADLWLGVVLVLLAFNIAGLFEANWIDSELQRLVLFTMAVPLSLARAAGPEPPAGESR